MTTQTTNPPVDDGRHDFDFLAGTWRVHHRKLADMTDPTCEEWVEFEGVQWMRQTLGGLGNVDNLRVESMPNGRSFEGMSVRLFDVEAGLWRIWWASTAAPGHLDSPVSGRWNGKRGDFHGADVVNGTPVSVRFEWTVEDGDTARWEQFFSFDEGSTWVHNWRMSFTRLDGDTAPLA
ncbi:hypothetical protein [Streptacidiphilus jiangxiensis]|nr:hypothetical protein [Streptacidiphilus jiangxiensis]